MNRPPAGPGTRGGTPALSEEFYKGTTLVSFILTSTAASPQDAVIALAKIAAGPI